MFAEFESTFNSLSYPENFKIHFGGQGGGGGGGGSSGGVAGLPTPGSDRRASRDAVDDLGEDADFDMDAIVAGLGVRLPGSEGAAVDTERPDVSEVSSAVYSSRDSGRSGLRVAPATVFDAQRTPTPPPPPSQRQPSVAGRGPAGGSRETGSSGQPTPAAVREPVRSRIPSSLREARERRQRASPARRKRPASGGPSRQAGVRSLRAARGGSRTARARPESAGRVPVDAIDARFNTGRVGGSGGSGGDGEATAMTPREARRRGLDDLHRRRTGNGGGRGSPGGLPKRRRLRPASAGRSKAFK